MVLLKIMLGVSVVMATLSMPAVAQTKARQGSASTSDDVFLALRAASRSGDVARSEELAARLQDYPIASYVDYFRLRPKLDISTDEEVRAYLDKYQGAAIADRMRNDWLLELGRTKNWALFDTHYPHFVLDDDTQVRCYALQSRVAKGENVATDARAVLVRPANYGEACTGLITLLAQTRQFKADDVWEQIRLANEAAQLPVIRRLAPAAGVAEATLVQAYEKPATIVARGPKRQADGTRAGRELFILALGRAARSSPADAVAALNKYANQLSVKERATAWSLIALQASYKLSPEALDYWRRTGGISLTNVGYEWKARIALRNGQWDMLRETIAAMPAPLRADSTWIYWLARVYRQQHDAELANKLFESIADENHFYGKLATEELGREITLPPAARAVTKEELAAIEKREGFQRALKFFDMNLRFEGVREWNWELRGMNERELLAAAEFARQSKVLDRMVNTSERTKEERDFNQRFPMPFRDVMAASTNQLGLDMAWVYGLIRQESRFVMNARSHVGATGLMQLMPATARYVAKKIGMRGFNIAQVNDLETNIALGTNYLNMVLQDLDGSQALATAAYNAGPGRPRAWRSTLPGEVEGAIFAETIPFTETRDYVKKVLSNATYYAALMDGRPQSLKARLGKVAPANFIASELP